MFFVLYKNNGRFIVKINYQITFNFFVFVQVEERSECCHGQADDDFGDEKQNLSSEFIDNHQRNAGAQELKEGDEESAKSCNSKPFINRESILTNFFYSLTNNFSVFHYMHVTRVFASFKIDDS